MRPKICLTLMVCLSTLGVAGSAMAATDKTALALIDTCLSRLHVAKQAADPVLLSDKCPELSLQLDNKQLAQLEPPLGDATTLGQLRDAQASLRSLRTTASHAHAPAIKGVPQLLKKIYDPTKHAKPAENPIDQMLEWISKKIKNYFKRDNWLTRNFHLENSLDKNTIKGFFNVLVVLMIVLVLYIVVNEMRAADILKLLKRRQRKRADNSGQELFTQDMQSIGINEIGKLPINRQVPALLQYTLHYLMDRQVLPRRNNLTNQEFLGILKQKLPDAGNNFEQLVNSGERIVYGKQSLDVDDASLLFDHVRHIEQIPLKAGR